jgi:hypothetical protein
MSPTAIEKSETCILITAIVILLQAYTNGYLYTKTTGPPLSNEVTEAANLKNDL